MLKFIAALLMRALGWQVEGVNPPIKKAVVVIAPHTSNWDWLYLMLAGLVLARRFRYIVRDDVYATWYKRPLLALTGAIPLDHSRSMVDMVAENLHSGEERLIVIAPEGALRRTAYWKSGFYYMAIEGGVPLVCIALDYGLKTLRLSDVIYPSGDIIADMPIFRAFYAGVQGKHPDQFGPVKIDDEDRVETLVS